MRQTIELEGLTVRKVVQVSSGSFMVCLPKDWVEDKGLTKGAKITMKVLDNGCLLIIPQELTTRITLEGLEIPIQQTVKLR